MENDKSLEVFAKAPIRKAVLQNALPAMAAMLMVLIYNLADTFFIGQTHDDLQVAAVSLATPVFLLFMSVGTVFGIGGTSVHLPAPWAKDGRTTQKGLLILYVELCCCRSADVCTVPDFMDQILALIGASAETWDYARTYLTIVSCSGPFVLIANCYSNVIRAEGQSGKAMMGQLLGNLLNVILDPVMILVFGWNIAGAAIATVIGKCGGRGILRCLLPERLVLPQHQPQGLFREGKGSLRRSGNRHSCCLGKSSDEPFQHPHEQSDGKIR